MYKRQGKTTAYGINPDMAVAIDVCHGITPDNSDNAFEVGTGTVLSVGPNLHPKLTDELFAVSKRHGIKAVSYTHLDVYKRQALHTVFSE